MAGCTRKKICLNFDKSDTSSIQNCIVHSRYSSASKCKVYETNKPRKVALPTREMRSAYPLRENIWEYLNEDKKAGKFNCSSKRRTRQRCKQAAGKAVENNKIWLVFMLLLFVILTLTYSRLSDFIAQSKFITKVVPKTRLISLLSDRSFSFGIKIMLRPKVGFRSKNCRTFLQCKNLLTERPKQVKRLRFNLVNIQPTVEEKCCYVMKNLAASLLRAEHTLRNTHRIRRLMMITSRTSKYDAVSWQYEGDHIEDATVMRGSGTREWGSRVALWGLLPLWRVSPPPSTVLATRTLVPSDCWPFSGSRGEMVIELKQKTEIRSISIEHVRPDTAKSAPKNFVLFGILDNGTFAEFVEAEYRNQGPAKQLFEVTTRNTSVQKMIFRVLSNQGNPKYTCVYRIHLYGNGTKLNT